MKGQIQGWWKLIRTSFCLGILSLWGPAVGQSVPTSSCDSDIFEVQFKAVCPRDTSEVERTFEESQSPLLLIRLVGPKAPTNQTVWASFGASPLMFPKASKSLFTLALSDGRIFHEKTRQKVQLTYLKNTTQREIEIAACDDPEQLCDRGSKSLVPKALRYPRCQVPQIVVLPVYAGCR